MVLLEDKKGEILAVFKDFTAAVNEIGIDKHLAEKMRKNKENYYEGLKIKVL